MLTHTSITSAATRRDIKRNTPDEKLYYDSILLDTPYQKTQYLCELPISHTIIFKDYLNFFQKLIYGSKFGISVLGYCLFKKGD